MRTQTKFTQGLKLVSIIYSRVNILKSIFLAMRFGLKTTLPLVKNYFWRSVERSDYVGTQAYLCRCWARMSHVSAISNQCDSAI